MLLFCVLFCVFLVHINEGCRSQTWMQKRMEKDHDGVKGHEEVKPPLKIGLLYYSF